MQGAQQNQMIATPYTDQVANHFEPNMAEDVCWLLQNKDWEYLNYDYLVQNDPRPPPVINSVRLHRCKLEVTCLYYVE